jgi:hypothetical protein
MNLFGKYYSSNQRFRYTDSPLKKVVKTTLGVSLGLAVSYYCFKHGLPSSYEHFSNAIDYKDHLSIDADERVSIFFATLAATPLISVASMLCSGLTYNAITNKPASSKLCIMALITTPLALSAFSLHFDPTWSDTLINSFKIIKDFGLVATIGAGSIVGLFTPLFGDKMANQFESLLKKVPKFNELAEKHAHRLQEKQEQKVANQHLNYLKNSSKNPDKFDLYASYQSIRSTLEYSFKENHLNELNTYFALNNFYTKSEYILNEGSLENQFEVKKLFQKTVPQLIVEYQKGLHRLDRDIQLERIQKLNSSFLELDTQLDTLVNHAKNHEKMNNSMDYDEALTHIQSQFNHTKKLNHF